MCYESFPSDCVASSKSAPVLCMSCPYAVCRGCAGAMTMAGHNACPMCRALWVKLTNNVQLQMHTLVHAMHCNKTSCLAQCVMGKQMLERMEAHVKACTVSEANSCKMCKLHQALKRFNPNDVHRA